MPKRIFDIVFSLTALLLCWGLMLLIWALAATATKSNGLFIQSRIGRYGKPFRIFKFRTIDSGGLMNTTSIFLRRSKLDELPQVLNVLIGDMSLVGPRPDIPGYYDRLQGEEQKILELRPGITSEASIKYKNEEALLSVQKDPLFFNDNTIFPDKVRMNLDYYYNRSFVGDLKILWKTVFR